ncbi:MAG: ATP-binding protein [Candidatus Micrarchaeota archaeon]|nr:ATP-binding protein [Candidatus Micrarchaeota archaeon]
MALIQSNGHVTINPTRPKGVITAHLRLVENVNCLVELRKDFCRMKTAQDYNNFTKGTDKIRNEYSMTVSECARVLKEEIAYLTPYQQRYYGGTLDFLSRASEQHTILPFASYLPSFTFPASNAEAEERSLAHSPVFRSHKEHFNFLRKRLDDAVLTGKSYIGLLSGGLSEFVQPINLEKMISKIRSIQLSVAMARTNFPGELEFEVRINDALSKLWGDEAELSAEKKKEWVAYYGKEESAHLGKTMEYYNSLRRELEKNVVVLKDTSTDYISRNIQPLVYFLLAQTISNAFKASFLARNSMKTIRFQVPAYKNAPEIHEPRIEISLKRAPDGGTAVTVKDNGIGANMNMLAKLFMDEFDYAKVNKDGYGVFAMAQPSNSMTIRTFPFIADITGTKITYKSEIGKGLEVTFSFPPDLMSAYNTCD